MGLRRTAFLVGLAELLAACSPAALLDLAVPRAGYHVERDLAYGADPRQKLDLYVPDKLSRPAPVLLFFYGGSWKGGSKSLYRAFGQAFAAQGIIVAIADYRLYPQVRYPAFVQDGALAFAWLRVHAASHGGDPGRLFLTGHSAGAYIAVMMAADPSYLKAAGADLAQVRGVIGIAGPYDFLPLTDADLITIFGGANRRQTQPIDYIDGLRAPMLLATGTDDRTVSPANTSRLAAKLRSFGSMVEEKHYTGTGPYRPAAVAGARLSWADIPLPGHAGFRARALAPGAGLRSMVIAGFLQRLGKNPRFVWRFQVPCGNPQLFFRRTGEPKTKLQRDWRV